MRQVKVLVLVLALCTSFAITGCKKNVHPGAISVVDSNLYDTLLVAQGSLEEARKTVAENPTPLYIQAFNKAAAIYNQAEADWQLYHSSGDGTLLTKLQGEVDQVVKTIADMRKAFGKKVGAAVVIRHDLTQVSLMTRKQVTQ